MSEMKSNTADQRREEIKRQYEVERKKMIAARDQRDRLRVSMFSMRRPQPTS